MTDALNATKAAVEEGIVPGHPLHYPSSPVHSHLLLQLSQTQSVTLYSCTLLTHTALDTWVSSWGVCTVQWRSAACLKQKAWQAQGAKLYFKLCSSLSYRLLEPANMRLYFYLMHITRASSLIDCSAYCTQNRQLQQARCCCCVSACPLSACQNTVMHSDNVKLRHLWYSMVWRSCSHHIFNRSET